MGISSAADDPAVSLRGMIQASGQRPARTRGCLRCAPLVFVVLLSLPATSRAQTKGQIIGRVIEAESRSPIATAEVHVEGLEIRAQTTERGDFILSAVPAGEHRVRVERLGFRTTIVSVSVRAGRATQVTIELETSPIEVEGVTAEVERTRLIEPDVTVTRQVIPGRVLLELPIDNVEEAVELTTGVAEGHFRGGRVGQESYRIDGLEVKNLAEASTTGLALELSPSSLAEIEVVTGGFGADNGSALSGVVNYATRHGNPERWDGRFSVSSDQWLPDDLYRGFTGLSASLGGPIGFLGAGSTIFTDLLAQGMVDSDPRARGLTCLAPDDGDDELAAMINTLADDPAAGHLYCPFTAGQLPYQRGDKLIGFARIDRPLAAGTTLNLLLIYNRRQQELYTPEFKYNTAYQLGQRAKSALASLTLDWARQSGLWAHHVQARASAMRMDRYLGVLDPWTFSGRSRVAGFGPADFRFLGEDFVRSPIEEQLESGAAVPGYARPGGTTGSPFGPAAEGVFFTEGTPEIANWNRSGFLSGDLRVESRSTRGHVLRGGISGRFYEVESYERVLAYLPGSSPNFARFYPTTANGYLEASLLALHDVTIQFGVRVEAFRSGLTFQADENEVFAPTIDTDWKVDVMPRLGVAVPIPGSEGRTMFRFNYGLAAQPPDFRFFLDTTIGDSLRVDIRRQGNPNLTFERATSWEASISQLLSQRFSFTATAFYKELNNLITSSLSFTGFGANQFTTGDFGTVKGLELVGRAYWPGVRLQAGYALQDARGVTSGAFEDLGEDVTGPLAEFPLAFDRRHSFDLIFMAGRVAGALDRKWGVTLTGSLRSGYPLARTSSQLGTALGPVDRLPWTHMLNLRVIRDFGGLPGCRRCRWSLVFDGRNLLGQENIVALRRDTGTVAPTTDELRAIAGQVPADMNPIPRESPDYSALADLNGDGLITAGEARTVRLAAAIDRYDPSLYFGEARQLRLGLEIVF